MRAEVLAIQTLASFRLSKTGPKPATMQVVSGSGLFGTGLYADARGEANQLASEIDGFDAELARKVNIGNTKDPQWIWYSSQWLAFKKDFYDFYNDQVFSVPGVWKVLYSPFLTKKLWDDLQDYRERFKLLYDTAKNMGIDVKSAPPTPRKADAIDQAINKVENAVTSIWDFLKPVIIIAVIALGLGFIVFQLGR